MRILVFGDSIAHGVWDPEGGWVQRLRMPYYQQTVRNLTVDMEYPDIFNLSVPSDTVKKVAARLEAEAKARLLSHEETLLVFAVGINDTVLGYKDYESSPPKFIDDLQHLYDIARPLSGEILFVGMTNVDDAQTHPWAFSSGGESFLSERVWEFEVVLREFCSANKVPIVQVFERFKAMQEIENILPDGLHPSDRGHQLIADLVRPYADAFIKFARDKSKK